MAASDKALGDLHSKLATVLSSVLDGREDADGIKLNPSAAEMAVIVTFLKNNNITADASDNAELAALRDKLAQKRKDRKASLAGLQDAAGEFQGMIGDMLT
jgi:hypothetical protein